MKSTTAGISFYFFDASLFFSSTFFFLFFYFFLLLNLCLPFSPFFKVSFSLGSSRFTP